MPTLVNNFTKPVILDDDRDPYVSWQHHRERGSQGGVDLAYPEGTEVLSIADGTCEPVANYGTGGNTMRVRLDDGSYVEFMHLSSFARGNGERVAAGEVIGYSGSTGGDYAPHLHVHVYVNGTRCNVWDYFGADTSSGAQPSSSATMSGVLWSGDDWSYAEPIGDLMARVQSGLSARGLYNYDDGSARPADGIAGEFTRKGVQRLICDTGFFCGDIDGEIWRGGCYGIQDFAAAHGDYTERGGVRDGAPRSLSWECFAVGLDRLNTPPAPAPVVEPVKPEPVAEPVTVEPAVINPAPAIEPAIIEPTPEPEPALAVEPIPAETIPEPEPRPINEGDLMTLDNIPNVNVADGALGEIIDEPIVRRRVYSIWVIIGLTLQALTGGVIAGVTAGIAAVGAGWNLWLTIGLSAFAGIAGAYVALTPQVATLARANVKK